MPDERKVTDPVRPGEPPPSKLAGTPSPAPAGADPGKPHTVAAPAGATAAGATHEGPSNRTIPGGKYGLPGGGFVNSEGQPIDESGRKLDAEGRPLAQGGGR